MPSEIQHRFAGKHPAAKSFELRIEARVDRPPFDRIGIVIGQFLPNGGNRRFGFPGPGSLLDPLLRTKRNQHA